MHKYDVLDLDNMPKDRYLVPRLWQNTSVLEMESTRDKIPVLQDAPDDLFLDNFLLNAESSTKHGHKIRRIDGWHILDYYPINSEITPQCVPDPDALEKYKECHAFLDWQ